MAQATGAKAVIQIGEEDTYGAGHATPDGKLLYCSQFTLKKDQNMIRPKTLTSSRGVGRSMRGNINVQGNLGVELNAENTGILFKHLMGSVDTQRLRSLCAYLHHWHLALVGLWTQVDLGSDISGSGRYLRGFGVRISDATFNLAAEGPCDVSFSLVGVDVTPQSSSYDSSPTDTGATNFSMFDAAILEDGSAIATVKPGNIKIMNNLATDTYCVGNTNKRRSAAEGQADVSGSITVLFESADMMNKALGTDSSTLKVTFSRGDGLGTAGNESIELFVQNLDYKPATPEISGPGGIELTLDFEGFKSGSDLGLRIVTKNAVATI
ncbi:MAG: hypothetical protein IPN33_25980 [Saprospiraceae bacterium]|nr:hypothetical protein [Saprospiraceae bacterium]